MVFGIVKSHNGHIFCNSKTGVGTTFFIFFPVIQKKEYIEDENIFIITQNGTEKILLVDDKKLIQKLGKKMLNKFGYTVITANNGFESIEIYKKKKDDIALVILNLKFSKWEG